LVGVGDGVDDAAVAHFGDGAAAGVHGEIGAGDAAEFALVGAASAPAVDDEIAVGAGDDVVEFEDEIREGGEIHGHGLARAVFAVDGGGEGVVVPDVGVVEVGAVGVEIAGIESGEGVVDEFDVFLFGHLGWCPFVSSSGGCDLEFGWLPGIWKASPLKG
jgi:hypothetical protein